MAKKNKPKSKKTLAKKTEPNRLIFSEFGFGFGFKFGFNVWLGSVFGKMTNQN